MCFKRHHLACKGRRQWHPTPVLSPGKSHGRRSLVGCSPWGREESDTTSLSLSLFTFMHWRRKWQLTPVFLPGESQGPGSMVGCRLWGHTELDTTEDPACRCQETKRENLACTRTCNLQNLNYLLSDPVPEFTYSCPVAAALFEATWDKASNT